MATAVPRVGWYYESFPRRGHFTTPLRANSRAAPEYAPCAPLLQKRAFSLALEVEPRNNQPPPA
jgi:hypothetical protein